MANVSSVDGKLYITASSVEECEEVYKLIEIITDKWGYEFKMYNSFTVSEVIDSHSETASEVTMETPFYAEGRWSFQCNAEEFGRWLQNASEHNQSPKIHSAVEMLTKLRFVLEFEYNEDETGQQFVGVGNLKMVHTENTPLKESEILENEFEAHDLTIGNLVEYRGYDEKSAEEYLDELFDESR